MSKKNLFIPRFYLLIGLYFFTHHTTYTRQLTTPLSTDYLYIPYLAQRKPSTPYTVFANSYFKHAHSAFFEKLTRSVGCKSATQDSQITPCITKKNCCDDALAQLLLHNASPSLGTTLFAANCVCTPTANAIITLRNLCDAITYKEYGVELTAQYMCPFTTTCSWGMRAILPLKKITVDVKNQNNAPNSCCAEIVGVQKSGQFAYRLDALSTLALSDKVDARTGPLMEFGNLEANKPLSAIIDDERIQVRSRFINNTHLSNQDLTQTTPPAHVIESPCGVPAFPFGSSDVSSFIPLDDNGNNLLPGQRGKFQPRPIQYRELKRAPLTQQTLWVVPTLTNAGTVTRGASMINEHVCSLLQLLTHNDLNTCSTSLGGVGDFTIETYTRYQKPKTLYELIFGISAPTGKKKKALTVFQQPLGNNGHWQLNLGYAWHHTAGSCCTFFSEGKYSLVLPHVENILASFATDGIRNVGECAHARIWWQQYATSFAIAFHEKITHCYGGMFMYQLFLKEKDVLEFKQLTMDDCAIDQSLCAPQSLNATNPQNFKEIIVSDFFQRNKKVNSNLAASKSSCISHKIGFQLFWRPAPTLNFFTQVNGTVGGKNTFKEINYSLGLSAEC